MRNEIIRTQVLELYNTLCRSWRKILGGRDP